VLIANRCQTAITGSAGRISESAAAAAVRCRQVNDRPRLVAAWESSPAGDPLLSSQPLVNIGPAPAISDGDIDPFYLFACYMEWELREEPTSAWELIAAAQSSHGDTRAHARALLASSRHLGGRGVEIDGILAPRPRRPAPQETGMIAPYGINMVEDCAECSLTSHHFLCGFSPEVRQALNQVSHKSTLPAGAILFVEGQSPRGVFILCSGRVNLSTTSREGKILILKTAEPGEALGLSAAVSGMSYEATAETSVPTQVNFVDRKHLLELIQSHSEVGLRAAQHLSRDFQGAYRDIHDMVFTRSSAGKLARLLLAQPQAYSSEAIEARVDSTMTHEEMAQRIGASRETVTRLLSDLKRKQLIRLDGPRLIIRNRTALEALAV
jgi:CRP/FNR family transcriptional regulator, cyclic AMP receptor protein